MYSTAQKKNSKKRLNVLYYSNYQWNICFKIIKNVPFRKLQLINSYIPNKCVTSEVDIASFERLNYWDKKDRISKPGTSIKINLSSTTLKIEIQFFYVVLNVFHYIHKPWIFKIPLFYGYGANICKIYFFR